MSRASGVVTRSRAIGATASAFFRVDAVEEFNYPLSFAMRLLAVATPLIPFFFISNLVGSSPEVGGDYLTFTVIGLSMTALLSGAMIGFGTSLQRAFQRGTLETFLVEPVPWTTMPLAMNQWHVLQGIVYSFVIGAVGWGLGARFELSGIPAATLIAILGIIAALSIGIISAAVLLLTLKSTPVIRLYDITASLLAGSIFSVSQLPAWARGLSVLLPHTYVINGTRTALMANAGTYEVSLQTAIVALSIFDLVAFSFGLFLWRRMLEFSRKLGHLGGY